MDNIQKYIRAANYLTTTQIYLRDNFLLERPLEVKDLKQRLFGHWGTCPGINFVYAHLNYLVKKNKKSTIFVLGPGHGFPALQANLFLENTLSKYYNEATLDEKGIAYVSKMFSWPYGFSSHSNPEAPGLILEGGELGYSLSTAYGAALDNPDLLAVCMIGDGEAETGSIATGWHINKLIDPASNGAVLPILHVNEYKISGPTIFGRMSDAELKSLFTGYGYEPFFVKESHNINEVMMKTLEKCLLKINEIQKLARKNKNFIKPCFPMIILQTPKGWTGIKELKGKQIEGNILAHQVVAPNAKKDEIELLAIEDWLKSYKFEELFSKEKGFDKSIFEIIPENDDLKIGNNPCVYSNKIYKPLILPQAETLEKKLETPGKLMSNSMKIAGEFLAKIFKLNKLTKNFRLMSPDETYSNRLDEIFKETSRAFAWPIKKTDKNMSKDGRVMEMLSEHNLQGLAQGYILTGRHAVFTTYEAFAQIFSSMTHQYEKFLKVARTLPWRANMGSMNYLISSVLWRQEHNGFTHQNPSFVSSMLQKQDCAVAVYYPADDNSMLAVLEEVFLKKNSINIVVAGKTIEPRWLSLSSAKKQLNENGIAIWDFVSSNNPDVVVVGIGDYVSKEALAAIEMINFIAPEIKIRFINIMKLIGKCNCKDAYHEQIPNVEKYFLKNIPVIVNYHGYPEDIKAMVASLPNSDRFDIGGYVEEGGTTTPFDMQVRNKTSRFHIAIKIIEKIKNKKIIQAERAEQLITKYKNILEDHKKYVITYGVDPIELEEWHLDTNPSMKDDAIQFDILQKAKIIAVIGMSSDPDRYSNKVALYLKEKGYKVIPINPKLQTILGEKVYPDLLSVPNDIKVDIVVIYRRSEEIFPHFEEVVKRGNIKTIWLPEGVRNKLAEELAQKENITVVSDFCLMKVHQKLQNKKI